MASRGRRASLERFFDRSKPTLPGRVLIDDDDCDTYAGMKRLPAGWDWEIGPRVGCVATVNRAFAEHPDEPWYAVIADDMVCGPEGWDTQLANACQPHFIAWGDDGRWGAKLCTSYFVGGDLPRALGFLDAPMFGHLYADTVRQDIANGAAIGIYHPGIHCTHINVHDQTYAERKIAGDRAMYQKVKADGSIDKWIEVAKSLKERAVA